MFIVNNIKGDIHTPLEKIYSVAVKKAGLSKSAIHSAFVYRRALDARKETPEFVYSIGFDLPAPKNNNIVVPEKYVIPKTTGSIPLNSRPVVMGYGPAGIFCAYLLALCGYAPIVFEKGSSIDERDKKVNDFFSGGKLDVNTNVQFGEGGAGTYSDGKLTTRINSPSCRFILEKFVEFGAPEEILWLAKPHIGTDKLGQVVKNIRNETIRLGAQVNFNSEITNIKTSNGNISEIQINNNEWLPCECLIIAAGHSARNAYTMLAENQLVLQPKPFSVGVRIEHLQQKVNESLWGNYANDPILGSADYNVSRRYGDKGVYSFCMCPGGQVVAAASEKGGVVVNGMSTFARNNTNANSAMCVSVVPTDFGNTPLGGIEFQRELERRAFTAAGSNYKAPAVLVGDFLENKVSKSFRSVLPSYPIGTEFCDMSKILPGFVVELLQTGLRGFAKNHSFFSEPDAVLTGVETRTSSPVRILRDENLCACGYSGIYPCGEGAGYAGGIMSAAADGIRIAEKIISTYNRGE